MNLALVQHCQFLKLDMANRGESESPLSPHFICKTTYERVFGVRMRVNSHTFTKNDCVTTLLKTAIGGASTNPSLIHVSVLDGHLDTVFDHVNESVW